MASDIKYLTVSSLRAGLNDFEPPLSLDDDSCTVAENVEFFYSTLGERRFGCVAINLPAVVTGDAAIDAVTWGTRHLPTNNLADAECWLLAQGLNTAHYRLVRRTKSAWSQVTEDHLLETRSNYGHKLSAVSLHGKLFVAGKSTSTPLATSAGEFDRIRVWDGTYFRLAGQAAPTAAPTAIDSGGGALVGTRYYRVRFVTLSGSTVVIRSEPSPVLTFAPSGAGASIIITRPASSGGAEHETQWEIEASTDNANFYRISRVDIATTTYTDSTTYATGYSTGVLSEDLTAYTLIPSGKFLTVDSDRLIIAGSWENSAYASRVWWTPVYGNTGVGNDERLDMTVNPFIDLDGFEGGELTAISRGFNGYLYAFKFGHIYKIIRTGQRDNAYEAIPITKARGAFPGSLVEAVDEAGSPALYFLDPKIGPMRIGSSGLEWCGKDLVNLWARVNQSATIPAAGVFYQAKNQVHFWVALDGSDHPNAKIIVQCDQLHSGSDGARRGWVTVPVGDRIADIHCAFLFSDNIDSTDDRNQVLVPFIGKQSWVVNSNTITNYVQRCDTGSTDALVDNDEDAYYYGMVQTKPFTPAGILNQCGVLTGTLVAEAVLGATNPLYVQGTRNFSTEGVTVSTIFTPSSHGEDTVIKTLDEFSFSEARTIQIAMGDLDKTSLPTSSWRLHRLAMKLRMEQTS